MQSIGNSLRLGVKQVRAGAYILSGPISRCYVVLELCGTDFSIFVQIE